MNMMHSTTPYKVDRRDTGASEAIRRALLPRWIRIFSWFFLLETVLVPVAYVAYPFLPDQMRQVEVTIFGLEYQGVKLAHPVALGAQAFVVAAGVAAFGLLRGKTWGLTAGIMVGVIPLADSALSTIAAWSAGKSSFGLGLILPVAFLISLLRRRQAWHAAAVQTVEDGTSV